LVSVAVASRVKCGKISSRQLVSHFKLWKQQTHMPQQSSTPFLSFLRAGCRGLQLDTCLVIDASVQQPVSPLLSLFTGGVAGRVEATIPYPLESTTTGKQLQSKANSSRSALCLLQEVIKVEGIKGVYTGCSTLVVVSLHSSDPHSSDRKLASLHPGHSIQSLHPLPNLQHHQNRLLRPQGHLSTSRGILVASAASTTESLLAITPISRLKTTLIDAYSASSASKSPCTPPAPPDLRTRRPNTLPQPR
jgi:Mitochondrial carrier protein